MFRSYLGYVYLLTVGSQSDGNLLVKIGKADNTFSRVRCLRRHSDKTIIPKSVDRKSIRVLALTPTNKPLWVENEIHKAFADRRVEGEWFLLSYQQVSSLTSYLRIQGNGELMITQANRELFVDGLSRFC